MERAYFLVGLEADRVLVSEKESFGFVLSFDSTLIMWLSRVCVFDLYCCSCHVSLFFLYLSHVIVSRDGGGQCISVMVGKM